MLFVLKRILHRKIAATMVYSGLVLFGLLSIRDIPIALLPNIELPKLSIITTYANSAPTEIENLITKPISEIVGTIPGVEKVESESIEGYSFVHLRFKNGTDMHYALLEVREKLDLIRDFLPQDASKPLISRFDPNQSAFMEVVFFSQGLSDDRKLRQYIEDNIKVYLDRIDGVAAVQLSGGFQKEVLVEIDPERMNAYRVLPQDLKLLLSTNNKNYPAGQLPFGKKDLLVRAIGEFDTLGDVQNTIVSFNDASGPVYLSDFSQVKERYKNRNGLTRFNGKECVVVYIFKEPGKNTVSVSEEVTKVLSGIEDQFKQDIALNIVYDESDFIRQSISNLFMNLLIGSILAFIALFLILKNFQSPSLLLLAIPVTLFPSFLIFKFLGISFNMMSLGGLALGIGMLFDSSNVVLSAIERNLILGKKIEDAVLKGTGEVTSSIFSATSTTVIVFLPIAFLKSTLGIVFSEMAIAIVITLLMSLIVAITFIPLAASVLYRLRDISKEGFERFSLYNEKKLIGRYHDLLLHLIERPKQYLFLVLSLFVFSFSLIPMIQKEFLPKVDTGEFNINVSLPKGTDLDTMSDYMSFLEEELLKDKRIQSVIVNIGGEEENLKINPKAVTLPSKAVVKVILKEEESTSTSEVIQELRKKIQIAEGTELSFDTRDNVLGAILEQKQGSIEYLIVGSDLDSLQDIGLNIKRKLLSRMDVLDVRTGMEEKNSEYHIDFDQVKMAKFGLTNANVSNFVKIALKGMVSSSMKISGMDTSIRIGMDKKYADSLEKVKRLKIRTPFGENISLEQFVQLREEKNLTSVMRIGNFRVNTVAITVDPRFSNAASDIKSVLGDVKLPQGFKIQVSGEEENLAKSWQEVLLSFSLALLLIYMLLSAQFESYSSSFLMIFSIPLIFIGTFPALFISGKSLNISSFMGFILLMGVVVDNASLYYEYYQLFLEETGDSLLSVMKSSEAVFKPVMMNNTTTILGMMPVVLELGKGSEFQAPLGVVVVSGLLTSTLLSLLIIPLVFYKFRKHS
ncbi:efflux RND transporter permease subunit [Leptospira idonii]|uniref:Efflux RND transporter permease subunit n=1 Tax=Leptospira idonii TaxID=1193500 RepID=A0A4R9LTK6_9LEPT|nr:efflux RND transporter permease subunit [Leptospira idonii]TGN16946.1 efflux RND transporter permease subunit [Leptospira idonii]